MRKLMALVLTAVMTMSLAALGCAKNASERRAATPTLNERISKESINGQVNDIGTRYVSIKDKAGESRRVRVDDRTKMDQIAIGDQVKAYVTEDGYASTIQRVVD